MSDVTSFHVSSFCPCLFWLTCFPDELLYEGAESFRAYVFKMGRGAFCQECGPVSEAADPRARRVLSCLTCCYSNLSTSAVPHSFVDTWCW